VGVPVVAVLAQFLQGDEGVRAMGHAERARARVPAAGQPGLHPLYRGEPGAGLPRPVDLGDHLPPVGQRESGGHADVGVVEQAVVDRCEGPRAAAFEQFSGQVEVARAERPAFERDVEIGEIRAHGVDRSHGCHRTLQCALFAASCRLHYMIPGDFTRRRGLVKRASVPLR
jgi:hypothetical protein